MLQEKIAKIWWTQNLNYDSKNKISRGTGAVLRRYTRQVSGEKKDVSNKKKRKYSVKSKFSNNLIASSGILWNERGKAW